MKEELDSIGPGLSAGMGIASLEIQRLTPIFIKILENAQTSKKTFKIMVKIENVKKQYTLGVIGGTTLKDSIARWWAKIRKKELFLCVQQIIRSHTVKKDGKSTEKTCW
jgi:hypothetical protein